MSFLLFACVILPDVMMKSMINVIIIFFWEKRKEKRKVLLQGELGGSGGSFSKF